MLGYKRGTCTSHRLNNGRCSCCCRNTQTQKYKKGSLVQPVHQRFDIKPVSVVAEFWLFPHIFGAKRQIFSRWQDKAGFQNSPNLARICLDTGPGRQRMQCTKKNVQCCKEFGRSRIWDTSHASLQLFWLFLHFSPQNLIQLL